MKKEEAIKKLSNTKVYVDGKSEEIQKKLFELGFKWKSGQLEEPFPEFMDKPFIFITKSMFLGCSANMIYFTEDKYKEIKAADILSITIDKECEFKPFDKVLVRDYNTDAWRADLFSHANKVGYKFTAVGCCWQQCIPFEGNEHLVGTTDSPDKY